MSQDLIFKRKLQRAGWYTYTHTETGRLVTNAYPDELMKLERISGVPCEIVERISDDPRVCCRIGPAARAQEPQP